MAALRLVVALALLASLGAAAAALVAYGQGGAGATGTYPVEIVGPDGVLYAGEVQVAEATALRVLQAAADEAGLTLTLDEYPGMGTYVRGIGPHQASGASGWVYEVRRDGAWTPGDRSAALRPLAAGDAVRWSWTEG